MFNCVKCNKEIKVGDEFFRLKKWLYLNDKYQGHYDFLDIPEQVINVDVCLKCADLILIDNEKQEQIEMKEKID